MPNEHEDEHEHETKEGPVEMTAEELEGFLEEFEVEFQEEEQEETVKVRTLPPLWGKKDKKLYIVVINDGPETKRDVVVSVEYAGGTYTWVDPKNPKNKELRTGKQNREIKKSWKKGEKKLLSFAPPNEDCWNPHLLFDVTVDTGGNSEKNETVIVHDETVIVHKEDN